MDMMKNELSVFLKLNKSNLSYNKETGEHPPVYTVAVFDMSKPGNEKKTVEDLETVAIQAVLASKVVDSTDCIEIISADEYYDAVGDDEDDDDFEDEYFDDDEDDFEEDEDDFEDDEDGEIVDRAETLDVTG